jgi:hypothetical protein
MVSRYVAQRHVDNMKVNDRVSSNTVCFLLGAMDLLLNVPGWRVQAEDISGKFSSYLVRLTIIP